MKNTITIIMYHYVRNLVSSRYPDVKGLDYSMFKTQLDFLQDFGNFVSCGDVLEAFQTGKKLPDNAILLTFDDGYIDHYTMVFPLLMERSIPAFFSMPGKVLAENKVLDVNKIHFILASTPIENLLPLVYERLDYYRGRQYKIEDNQALFTKLGVANRFDCAEVIFVKRLLQVELPEDLRNRITDELFLKCVGMEESAFAKELYMTREQVEFMKRSGMEWGIHGYDHYWMNRLSTEELKADIEKSLEVFDGIVPQQGWMCCYPYGSVSDSVIDTVQTLGAAGGFSTVVNLADLNKHNIFSLPRFDTNDFPPKSENFKNF